MHISFMNKHFLAFVLDIMPGLARIDAISNISMVGRPRPIFYPLNKPVLDRIVMNVIDMALQVFFVANLMFPEPALPDAPFAFASA